MPFEHLTTISPFHLVSGERRNYDRNLFRGGDVAAERIFNDLRSRPNHGGAVMVRGERWETRATFPYSDPLGGRVFVVVWWGTFQVFGRNYIVPL